MGRDITKLHPELQKKIPELIAACKKEGINIKIGECFRSVAEQDALYAQGRSKPGNKVTNAKGSSYSSMHQWGVAFDFYLNMDIDRDGKTSDDIYNNATRVFNRVGAIGKKLGLEWGGDWRSITDLPHFQLPNWGSTTSKLKSMYGNFEAFRKTWNTASKISSHDTSKKHNLLKSKHTATYSKTTEVAPAQHSSKAFVGTYKVSSALRLRTDASTKAPIITVIPKHGKVSCFGYYSKDSSGATWYYVSYGKYTGYVSAAYCQKSK